MQLQVAGMLWDVVRLEKLWSYGQDSLPVNPYH
jgi:hypothetical protein